jgi:glutamyl-tRNA reductase
MNHSPVELHTVGVSIHNCSLDVLERIVKTVLPSLSDFFGNRPDGYGVGVLSTCNRFEIYSLVAEDVVGRLYGLFDNAGVDSDTLFAAAGEDAVRHLIEVACGIHSIVFGEPEILDQVRSVQVMGRGFYRQNLAFLFKQVYEAGRRIRAAAGINGTNSIAKLSVKFLMDKIDIKTSRVLVIGYGTVGRKVVQELRDNCVSKIYVICRKTAGSVEENINIEFEKLDSLPNIITYVDAVISATSAPNYVITAETLRYLPKNKRLVIIDLSMPRNVDPSIALLNGVELYNIVDLIPTAERMPVIMLGGARFAELVNRESKRIYTLLKASLEAEEVLKNFRVRAENIRLRELSEAFDRLTGNIEHDKVVLDMFSRSLVNKLLHNPTVAVRKIVNSGVPHQFIDIIREVFSSGAE